MAAYFTSPDRPWSLSPSSKRGVRLDDLDFQEKERRRSKIDDMLNAETEMRVEGNSKGIVGEYFKREAEKAKPCINNDCCKLWLSGISTVCCYFCRGKRRFCALIIFILVLIIGLYTLTYFDIIKRPKSSNNDSNNIWGGN